MQKEMLQNWQHLFFCHIFRKTGCAEGESGCMIWYRVQNMFFCTDNHNQEKGIFV